MADATMDAYISWIRSYLTHCAAALRGWGRRRAARG